MASRHVIQTSSLLEYFLVITLQYQNETTSSLLSFITRSNVNVNYLQFGELTSAKHSVLQNIQFYVCDGQCSLKLSNGYQ